MPLSEEALGRLTQAAENVPTFEQLNNAYAVMINELILRVRDRIADGNVEEVVKALSTFEHLYQLGYAINQFEDKSDKVDNFFSKREIEELVEKAVEKVYEKVREEDTNAVARKLKMEGVTRGTPRVLPVDQADKPE